VALLFINQTKNQVNMAQKGITVRIDDELREALQEGAEKRKVTISEHIREILMDKYFIEM